MTLRWSWIARWFIGLSGLAACGDEAPKDPPIEAPDASSARDDAGEPSDGDPDGGSVELDAGSSDAGRGGDGDGGGDGDTGADAGTPPAPWYDSKTPLELNLSGALGDAFAAAFAGMPDGIVPPVRLKDPFAGTAAYASAHGAAHTAAIVLSVRGNSSLQECFFPKLKLAFEQRVEDPSDVFFATKKVKIGTHCGEEDTVNGTIGRLRHEKATWREEVVYQLARALGITIMQTRPATIRYTDTSAAPQFESPLTRKAFLLEHVDELARRLGATALQDPVDCGEDPTGLPEAEAVLRIKFFHAMIGNWDWMLGPPEAHGCGTLWNTEVLTHPDGALTLVPTDFDLAAFVVGEVRNPDTNQLEAIDADNAQASARAYLESSLQGESAEAVAAMKAEFLGKREALRAVIDASLMDGEGKAAGRLLVDGFFAALAEPAKRAD